MKDSAIGAALHTYHSVLDHPRRYVMKNCLSRTGIFRWRALNPN